MKNITILFTIVFAAAGCGQAPPPPGPMIPTEVTDKSTPAVASGLDENTTPMQNTTPADETVSVEDTTSTDPSETANNPPETVVEVQGDASPKKEVKAVIEKVERTEDEWKELLTPQQYYVLREKGTERPFQNEFDHHFEPGTYVCGACGLELFDSDTKFNSGCGWPAFYAAQAGDRVELTKDHSLGMVRTEVTCSRCDSHLGHIFDDAPQTPTGQRYCINSVSLKFIPAAKADSDTPPDSEKAANE